MKKVMGNWIGFVLVLSLLLAACSPISPSPQAEQPRSAERVVSVEPTAESVPAEEQTESVATEEPTAVSVVTEEPTEGSVVTEEPESTENVDMEEPEIAGLSAGEMAPEFSLTDSNGNMVNLTEVLRENEQVALVFYIRHSCAPCMAQLTQIDNDLAKYEAKGAQVIAIAVQNQRQGDASAKVSNVQFPILLGDKAVAEAYGVLEYGVSIPSVFLINKDRQIFWSNITYFEGFGVGCGTDRVPSQTILENLSQSEETVSSLNPVMTPDGDQVGESELERDTDKILLKFEACCVTPGNAYTAWWLIGDVTKPMSAVKSLLATGFVAEDEQVILELELKASLATIKNPLDGVRLAVLDHGEATGDPFQLSTPGGGCTTMPCPVALETSHAAP